MFSHVLLLFFWPWICFGFQNEWRQKIRSVSVAIVAVAQEKSLQNSLKETNGMNKNKNKNKDHFQKWFGLQQFNSKWLDWKWTVQNTLALVKMEDDRKIEENKMPMHEAKVVRKNFTEKNCDARTGFHKRNRILQSANQSTCRQATLLHLFAKGSSQAEPNSWLHKQQWFTDWSIHPLETVVACPTPGPASQKQTTEVDSLRAMLERGKPALLFS